MKPNNLTLKTLMIMSLAVLLFVSACSLPSVQKYSGYDTGSSAAATVGDIETKHFASKSDLVEFLRQSQNSFSPNLLYSTAGIRNAAKGMDVSMESSAEPASGSAEFSETNIQVAGVDEADIIKTDGDYIYTVSGSTLFIVKAYPGEDAEVVSKIRFNSTPSGLFVKGNKLAVFGNFYDERYFESIAFMPRKGMAFFEIYDISDRKNPVLSKEYKFEGSYFRSRMIGDKVYFITTESTYYTQDPLPIIFDGNIKKEIPVGNIFYYNVDYKNPVFVNINSVSLENSEIIDSKSLIVEGSQNMYMSKNSIYITYTQYINEWDLQREIIIDLLKDKISDSDKELISLIKNTDDRVLSGSEKENKIFSVYQSYIDYMGRKEREEFYDKVDEKLKAKLKEFKHMEFTVINKVDVDDGHIVPSANNKVPGHIINQFSMDEHKGILRIATTISRRWSRFEKETTRSKNNVYTLDSELNMIGNLEGIAEGEQIFSTRFIDDRLYMVTFEQVDPFFVIDLSDPYNIKTLGKLKIPGFSRYLHPYDKDIVIGIGRDATETGRQKGLKISLFDVSDVSNPKEIASYVGSDRYAQSSALWEHKAFLFSKEKELLVIPVFNRDYDYRTGKDENSYNGAFVFRITKDSVELRGLIDHSGSAKYYWQPAVERSLYIEDMLYTKSTNLIRINRIDTLEPVKDINLESGSGHVQVY